MTDARMAGSTGRFGVANIPMTLPATMLATKVAGHSHSRRPPQSPAHRPTAIIASR